MKKKIWTLIVYTLMVFITTTAYEMYALFLNNYNIGLALASFELFSLITLKTIYPFFERRVLTNLAIAEEVGAMSIRETIRRQKLIVLYLGISNTLEFLLMLPFLTSMHNSMLFVIFMVVSNLLKVPFSNRLFNDAIENERAYYIGLIIVCLASIGYSINLSHPGKLLEVGDQGLLIAVLIKCVLDIIDSLLLRYITTARKSGNRTVTVQTVEEIKTYFTITAGIGIGYVLYLQDPQQRLMLNRSELIGILWIGLVVSLAGTLAVRLLTEITHSLSQPIQGIRPVFGFIPLVYVYYTEGGNSLDLLAKGVCMATLVIGVCICLINGNLHNSK